MLKSAQLITALFSDKSLFFNVVDVYFGRE